VNEKKRAKERKGLLTTEAQRSLRGHGEFGVVAVK
jgi:hypothetical protein